MHSFALSVLLGEDARRKGERGERGERGDPRNGGEPSSELTRYGDRRPCMISTITAYRSQIFYFNLFFQVVFGFFSFPDFLSFYFFSYVFLPCSLIY